MVAHNVRYYTLQRNPQKNVKNECMLWTKDMLSFVPLPLRRMHIPMRARCCPSTSFTYPWAVLSPAQWSAAWARTGSSTLWCSPQSSTLKMEVVCDSEKQRIFPCTEGGESQLLGRFFVSVTTIPVPRRKTPYIVRPLSSFLIGKFTVVTYTTANRNSGFNLRLGGVLQDMVGKLHHNMSLRTRYKACIPSAAQWLLPVLYVALCCLQGLQECSPLELEFPCDLQNRQSVHLYLRQYSSVEIIRRKLIFSMGEFSLTASTSSRFGRNLIVTWKLHTREHKDFVLRHSKSGFLEALFRSKPWFSQEGIANSHFRSFIKEYSCVENLRSCSHPTWQLIGWI